MSQLQQQQNYKSSRKNHTIPIPINNDDKSQTKTTSETASYNLRGLTSENEITAWSSFCEDCFRHKKPHPPTAAYFARHYYNDPSRDFTLIRILETATTTTPIPVASIASTARIFKRLLSTGGITPSPLNAGGIGEVCTSPQHRKRGLTTLLLQDAVRTMEDDDMMECSLLHASPIFVPFYEKNAGYECVVSPWSVVVIDSVRLFSSPGPAAAAAATIRLAQFPKDTPALRTIHQAYSEDRFVGCIIRSERYWNEYISREIGDSLWVMTIPNNRNDDETDGMIMAWISIRERDGHYQLREFGLDRDVAVRNGLNTAYVMGRLLKVALEQQRSSILQKSGADVDADGAGDKVIKLHLPNPIIGELREPDCQNDDQWIDWTGGGVVPKNDEGWMYKFFSKNGDDQSSRISDNSMAHFIEHWKRDHIIWPSDSF